MSMPKFPDLPNLDLESSIAQVISSIAMEELALSHIINAEGEKIQYVLGTLHENQSPTDNLPAPHSIDDILKINESVKDMLSTVSMNQMFLFAKLSAALAAYKITGNGNDEDDEGDDSDMEGFELVSGRSLGPNETGDNVRWIEIAKYGNYSLILRTEYLNIHTGVGHNGQPSFQNPSFGTTNNYLSSRVRQLINNWFTGENISGDADVLAPDATLRNFTVRNTALSALGSGPVLGGAADGLSKPIEGNAPTGYDIAFALSYGEAANFASIDYAWDGGDNANSPALAVINFGELTIPSDSNDYNKLWLRSPGNNQFSVSTTMWTGRVFQSGNKETGLIYPALWVESSIFAGGGAE